MEFTSNSNVRLHISGDKRLQVLKQSYQERKMVTSLDVDCFIYSIKYMAKESSTSHDYYYKVHEKGSLAAKYVGD